MHNRLVPVLGGVGLFAAMLGFIAAALAPGEEAGGVCGLVMALGLVAFLWSLFDRAASGPDRS
jgi:hypothetical protein